MTQHSRRITTPRPGAHRLWASMSQLLIGGALGLISTTAWAAATNVSAGWRVGLGTDLPLDVGAWLRYEGPQRVRLSVGLGVMPELYARQIADRQVSAGTWNKETGELVTQTLRSSLALHAHAGWRPLAAYGLYGAAGYRLFTFSGTATRGALLGAALGRSVPLSSYSGDYQIASSVHLLDLEIGWEWRLTPRWRAHLAVGRTTAMAATATVTPPSLSVPILESTLAAEAAAHLERALANDVQTWTASLGVSYGF